jgi:hypothetical protein
VNADECRKCGYNYALERALEFERKKRDRERFSLWLTAVFALVIFGAGLIQSLTTLDFPDGIAVAGFSLVVLWGAWCWIRAWLTVKFKSYRK